MKLDLNINLEHLNEAFTEIFVSLPDAIKKRNKIKEDEAKELEETEDDEDEGYGSEESEYTLESLEEDIYFETVLDTFNAYDYVRNILTD